MNFDVDCIEYGVYVRTTHAYRTNTNVGYKEGRIFYPLKDRRTGAARPGKNVKNQKPVILGIVKTHGKSGSSSELKRDYQRWRVESIIVYTEQL